MEAQLSLKAVLPLAVKGLRQRQITVVRQGPGMQITDMEVFF